MSLLLPLIPTGLLVVLLCLMIRNRAYKAWPLFFVYVAFVIAGDVPRFALQGHRHSHFLVYWLTDAGSALLGALAMYEIVRRIVRGLRSWWWTQLIFPVVVAVGVALSLARAHSSPPQVSGLLYYVVIGEIAVRFVQVLVFVGLVAFFGFFGFRWRQYPLGIAAGFGLYASVALFITTKLSDFGTRFTFLWGVISLVAYSLAVLIWIGFFREPEKEEPTLDPALVARYTAVLEQYLDALRRRR
jgi:hypothetical protein